jgi:hypothetical protein
MNGERRKRRREEILLIFSEFGNRLASVLDELDGDNAAANDAGEPRRARRRTPTRPAYVPNHDQKPSAEAIEKAKRGARRAGIPV